jgi:hypothetical protein
VFSVRSMLMSCHCLRQSMTFQCMSHTDHVTLNFNYNMSTTAVFLNIEKVFDAKWRRESQQSFNTLTPFYFLSYSLHVSVSTGHPQVRYTIRYLKDYFLIQQIRCTYTIWYRDVICCISVLQLVVLIHVIKFNIKIKMVKSVKFHVTSGVQKRSHI